MIETHPIQVHRDPTKRPQVNIKVTLKAYEVYCAVYSPQPALVTDGCRGGFGAGELIAFLYASSFPRSEWRWRVNEALEGMQGF